VRPAMRSPRSLLAPALGFAVALSTVLSPAVAWAEEPVLAAEEAPRPAERPATPEPGTSGRLALTGGALLVGWYGLGVGASFAFKDEPWAKSMRIPVAGPFIALKDMGCQKDDPDCTTPIVVVRSVLAVIDGVGQVGGLGVLLESLLVPSGSPPPPPPKRASVRAAPIVSGSTLGLAVSGEF
jgi:hypothetical protein